MLIEEKSEDSLPPVRVLKNALWENAAEPLFTKTLRLLSSFSKSVSQATWKYQVNCEIFIDDHLTPADQSRMVQCVSVKLEGRL